jgi:dihydroorotate dehydrogenase electron transfer subunit
MYEIVTITEVKKETPSIRTLRFKSEREGRPGQFVMVWIPGVDEVPMSLSYLGRLKGITVNNIGEATDALCKVKKGSRLAIRGPSGTSFDFTPRKIRKVLAVGGGAGMAPIAPAVEEACKKGMDVTAVIGARTASELLFERRMGKCAEVNVSTDDGSRGHHGFATELAALKLKESKADLIITCGPEIMMSKVLELGRRYKTPVQASVERYMKCGVGICDACSLGNGLLVCRNGPVFTAGQLIDSEFGKCFRDASGKKIMLRGRT